MRFHGDCFVGVLLLSLSAYGQAPPDANNLPTFQSKVRVVLVDVVVTDKDKPVGHLEKKDFEIDEDNRPQAISSFEEHDGGPSAPVKLPPMPVNVYTNYPLAQSDSVNILLLDSLNTQAYDQAYVHTQLVKYINQMAPGTGLAIFVLGRHLRMIQGVTTDTSVLLTALDDKKNGPLFSPLLLTNQQIDTDQTMIRGITSPAGIEMAQRGLDESHSFTAGSRITLTLQALQQLARYLAAIPGRKNLIWVADSFPITIFPSTELSNPSNPMHQYTTDLQQTADLLTPGQVAIYPVSAEGLTTQAKFDASRNVIPSMTNENLQRAANQVAMEELAKDTGGKAYYNTNGLTEAVADAVNNGASYYTLAYTPANRKMDGKYRRIKVKVLNENYKITYRRGYYADDVAQAAAKKLTNDPLMPLLVRGLPDFTQVLYKIRVLPASPQPAEDATIVGGNLDLKRPVTRYGVDFAIAVQDIKLDTTPDGTRHGNLEMVSIVYDKDGNPVNWVIRKPFLNLDPKLYAAMQKLGLQFHQDIDVPQGDVYLRTGVYDSASSKVGTLGVPLSAIAAAPAPR